MTFSVSSRLLTVILLCVLFQAGCGKAHNTLPITRVQKDVGKKFLATQPEIVVVGTRVEQGYSGDYLIADLVLVNPLGVPLYYRGYEVHSRQGATPGEIHPFYEEHTKTTANPNWQDEKIRWCGTGSGLMVVPPHHAGRFEAKIDLSDRASKIGVAYSTSHARGEEYEFDELVWSNELIVPPNSAQK